LYENPSLLHGEPADLPIQLPASHFLASTSLAPNEAPQPPIQKELIQTSHICDGLERMAHDQIDDLNALQPILTPKLGET
jgi:hypothetical protein